MKDWSLSVMKVEFVKNAKRNIIFGVINRIVVMACPFITKAVIQRVLGAEYLGLNSLFQSVLSVLSLGELGISSAIIYNMYEPIAHERTETVNALLNFYRKAYYMIGLIVLSIGLLILPFLPHLINGSYPDDINLVVLYLIYLFNSVISYFLFSYMSALVVVYQREDINSIINMVMTLLMNALQVFVLLFFDSYMLFCIIIPVCTILTNLQTAVVVHKMYPQYCCKGKISKESIQGMKKRIMGTFISKCCAISRNSLDSICTSAFLGLTITAIYNNYLFILTGVTGFMLIILTSVTGGIGNHTVTKTVSENYEELKSMDFVYMLLSGWFFITILCLSQPFMEIWMGENMLLPDLAVYLICIYFYLLKVGDMRSIYSNVKGLWWEHRWRSIVEAVLNVALNIVLGKCLGVCGILLATIITMLFIQTLWGSEIIFKYYFGIEYLKDYFIYHIKYFTITCMIAVVTSIVCNHLIFENDIGTFLARGSICVVLPLILYYLIYRKSPYFINVTEKIIR